MSQFRRVCLFCLPLLSLAFASGNAFGQSEPYEISQVFGEEILAPSASLHQIRSYILSRVAPPPSATNAQQWTEQAKRLRQHLLQEVVFHGCPINGSTPRPSSKTSKSGLATARARRKCAWNLGGIRTQTTSSLSVKTDTSPIRFPRRSAEKETATTRYTSSGQSAAAGSGSQTR